MRLVALSLSVVIGVAVAAQSGAPLLCKNIEAQHASEPITVDGVLDEPDWTVAIPGTGFIQNEPRPNEPATLQSEVRIVYDDDAIHIGATLFDPNPDSILQRMSPRDDLSLTDWFGVTIDPYKSGINGFEFVVTSTNVQTDMIVANEEEDANWHSVWKSAARITAQGWVVEMSIPYSAFRFPEAEVQDWSIQFVRTVGRTREKTFWNPIDPLKEGWLRQCGTVSGIHDISAPLRLMLYPYLSGYVQHFPTNDPGQEDWTTSFNGGMDVKLGLSAAYTLDMTLIPDFGQVVSDNVVLNLSPFEVQFNENRQFFTEGTELFQRGGLFYSRRIGGVPLLRGDLYNGLSAGETVVDDPGVSKLLNATKISGRGAGGLGLGMLNAVTRETHGSVRDSLGAERRVLTDPLTNYNVLVADQLLPNNGYVSLINTNVMRDGGTYDANSSALDFRLNNKARTIQGGGIARVSQQFGPGIDRQPGYAYTALLQKTGGSTTYALEYNQISDDFDPNDLGFWQLTNFKGVTGSAEYIKYKPKSPWQRWGLGFETEYLRVVQPDHFFNLAVELNTFWILKGFNAFGGHVRAEPVVTYDPFEARVPGRLYAFPTNVEGRVWISSNYNKPFAVDLDGYYRHFNDPGDGTGARDRKIMKASFEPRLRPNDRTFVILSASHSFRDEDLGWVAFDADSIILGRRDLWTTELGIEGQYIFNNRMALTLRARHYWSRARYVDFHRLLDDGYLAPTGYDGLDEDGQPVHDVDFDAFTVDLIFRWNFAPGSEMTLGWKDNIFTSDNVIMVNYFDDLRNTWEAPGVNSFSLKVLYFIDAGKMFRAKR